MRILILLSLCALSTAASAQGVSGCPPGPFSCEPWGPPQPGDPSPAPPPAPLFEAIPQFIRPGEFQGYIGLGAGGELTLKRSELPERAAEALRPYRGLLDPQKLYVFPNTSDNPLEGREYILFKGSNLE